jgi:ABC-type glycerol-3-phosphate transport system substrate-binding protein
MAPVHRLPKYRQAIEDGAGFEWGIASPPRSADQESTVLQIYGPGLAIFRSSPERQLAAWRFVRWLNEPEQQARWAARTSYYPTRSAALALMADYLVQNPQYEAALGLAAGSYAIEPATAGYDECSADIEQMLARVLAGGDANVLLSDAVERCTAELEQAQ